MKELFSFKVIVDKNLKNEKIISKIELSILLQSGEDINNNSLKNIKGIIEKPFEIREIPIEFNKNWNKKNELKNYILLELMKAELIHKDKKLKEKNIEILIQFLSCNEEISQNIEM